MILARDVTKIPISELFFILLSNFCTKGVEITQTMVITAIIPLPAVVDDMGKENRRLKEVA